MRPSLASAAICAFAGVLSLAPAAARADDEQAPRPRPVPPDTRSWRPTLALHASWGSLFGKADEAVSQADTASWGSMLGGQLSLPFHRHAAVQAWGHYDLLDRGTDACAKCKTTSAVFGLALAYHLLDANIFDPWFSAGAGYRLSKVTLEQGNKLDYSGIEALRIAIGSDYYPVRFIGVGPTVEFMVGRYLSRSPGSLGDGGGHTSFSAGLRIVISPFQLTARRDKNTEARPLSKS